MKTIVVPVHEDPGQEARLQAGLEVAVALDAHLTLVEILPPPVAMGDIATAAYLMVAEEERAVERVNRARTRERLEHEGLAWDWVDAEGGFASSLLHEAGLADLIVVNCRRDLLFAPDPRGVVVEVVAKARCPVLAVPDDRRGVALREAAVVAWDGSPPAMSALRGATPLLGLAAAVFVVAIDEDTSAPPPEAAAAYLSRHGVHAQIVRLQARGQRPDELILRACEVREAGYCVMGAFGRGRIAAEIFGGVTRRMLDAARLPLVMSR